MAIQDMLAPRRVKPLVALLAVYLALSMALRLVLWWQFGREGDIPALSLSWMLPTGVLNDLIVGLIFFAPFGVYLLVIPERWRTSRANRWILGVSTVLVLTGMLYLMFAEYYFFEEFSARFNLVAVDYLMYPTEVFGDIRDAYPVKSVLALTSAAGLATFILLRSWFLPIGRTALRPGKRTVTALLYLALISCGIGLVEASVAIEALSTTSNRVAREITSNGIATFFTALRTSELEYPSYYPTLPREQNLALLTDYFRAQGTPVEVTDDGRIERQFDARPGGLGRLNVVVVVEESFGAEFSRLYGSERDLTPNFDRYARQGIRFSHMYASGTRTVRGLEAISASFPPIPSVSILRRPGNEGIATWGRVMADQGYGTSFLYGGYGYFDNMNDYFGGNGFEVVDRTDIDSVRFENIWGVSDEDLFDRALAHFDASARSGKPFFSMIMTTSNHKPYTFRPGIPGVPTEGGGRVAGVRYADFALGYFLDEARQHVWSKDTVFVVLGDHGARVYGKADIPLRTYEVPLLVYAPGHLAPRDVTTLTSQIDVAPTVLGLLGFSYQAPFYGTDVLACTDCDRIALFSHNHDVAIYRQNELAIFGLNESDRIVEYDRASDSYSNIDPDPALADLGIAIYQTAYEAFRDGKYR
jgi:phosphoglycerol transferase MdoB-like AlkP superfamily enzyme